MKNIYLLICFLLLAISPVIVIGEEGFSSAQPSVPAKIYGRAFTIYTLQEACDSSPIVSKLTLRPRSTTIEVGDRVLTTSPDDSIDSDLVIEAFDKEGNFLPSVPVRVFAGSQYWTTNYEPGVILKDGSMDYWQAAKPGKFDIAARWACTTGATNVVPDVVTIQVVESSD